MKHAGGTSLHPSRPLRRRLAAGAGLGIAAAILCAGQPAFAATHAGHDVSVTKPNLTISLLSAQTTAAGRSSDCAGSGSHSGGKQATGHDKAKHDAGKGKKKDTGKGKSKDAKQDRRAAEKAARAARKAAAEKAAAEKAAAEQAAAEKAAEQKAAEQQKAAAELAARQLANQRLVMQRLAAKVHAIQLAQVHAAQVAQLEHAAAQHAAAKAAETAKAAKTAQAVEAAQVRSAVAQTPISFEGPTLSAGGQQTAPVKTPAKATKPAAKASAPRSPEHARPRAQADSPVLALPIQMFAAGLTVGAAPAILLALVLIIGMALVVLGTHRRKTARLS